jgi:hypothetical protein
LPAVLGGGMAVSVERKPEMNEIKQNVTAGFGTLCRPID